MCLRLLACHVRSTLLSSYESAMLHKVEIKSSPEACLRVLDLTGSLGGEDTDPGITTHSQVKIQIS
jgi:hypothetical protein